LITPSNYISSISAWTKSYLRRIQKIWPLSMLDRKSRNRKSRHRNAPDRKQPRPDPEVRVSRLFLRFPALFSYYSSSTSTMATGSDIMLRDPFWVPLGVRMRNRKLRNIRPNGTFSHEMTSSAVGLPLENMGSHMCDRKCPWGAL
jgi:hypothetical protein